MRAVYETSAHVIEIRVDVVAKNGNLLLNVPQLPDGTIDEECRHLLTELADWMALGGEGVHGTRSFRTGVEDSGGVVVDGFREKRVPWSPTDHRLTRRNRTVHAFQMAWPKDGRTVIRSTRPEDRVAAVRLLGHGPVPFDQIHPGGELVVDLPDRAPSRYVNALAIELGADWD